VKRTPAQKLLADYLKAALRVRGQKARLAREAGVSPVTVTDWSAGKYSPRMDQLDAIATALHVSVADLFRLSSDEKLNPLSQPVTPYEIHSQHLTLPGANDGLAPTALHAENDQLRHRLQQLTDQILVVHDAAADLADLVAVATPHTRISASRKTKPSRR